MIDSDPLGRPDASEILIQLYKKKGFFDYRVAVFIFVIFCIIAFNYFSEMLSIF